MAVEAMLRAMGPDGADPGNVSSMRSDAANNSVHSSAGAGSLPLPGWAPRLVAMATPGRPCLDCACRRQAALIACGDGGLERLNP